MVGVWAYYLVVFLAAFLLFQIQPMTSKVLLPGFGGGHLVWGACMVFYQATLLLGYGYAHAAQKRLGVYRYSRWHGLLLLIPFFCFPFGFQGLAARECGDYPVLDVLRWLLVTVGLPVLVLSTVSLVLQRWIAVSDFRQKANPYVLYSVSNLGSMLGLLTYPTIIEPLLPLQAQGFLWWGLYAVMAVCQMLCIPRRKEAIVCESVAETKIPFACKAGWFSLSAAGCALLLAVTNVITFDVASVSFLWVVPLSIYLLSFILTFKQRPWYPVAADALLYWAVLVGLLLHLMSCLHLALPVWLAMALHLAVLFVVCLNCAGRLARSRPIHPSSLTSFYLVMAFGGLMGSLLVSWIVPLVSRSLIEYPLSFLIVYAALGLDRRAGSEQAVPAFSRKDVARLALGGGAMFLILVVLPWLVVRHADMVGSSENRVLILLAAPLALLVRREAGRPWHSLIILLAAVIAMGWTEELSMGAKAVKRIRNYYGVYRVYDRDNLRYLQHGTTLHGRQYLSGPERGTPLAYFHPSTPAAGVLRSPSFRFRDIGMIGLGTGALAAYAGAGQTFTVYELDPDNLPIAERDFSYLSEARGKGARLVFKVGDGRVSLRQAEKGAYDLFLIDAFNSGSIPVHLLTVEAFREYLRVLKSDGLLLLHVSNKILDLMPVVYSNARALGVSACQKSNEGNRHPDAEDTYWMAISRDPAVIARLVRGEGWWQDEKIAQPLPRPWTDQYSNVFGAMFRK